MGTLVAGLALIPERGIHGTFIIAATANLLVGLAAIGLAFAGSATDNAEVVPAETTVAATGTVESDRRLLVVLGVFALSGLVSMALEVVWFRVLTLFLRPTVYGFSVMLATVLTGISLGSYLVTPFLRRRARWILLLALTELAIALTAVLSFRPISNLPVFSQTIEPLVARIFPAWLTFSIAGSVLTILATALLMGLAFPVGLFVWTGAGRAEYAGSARRLGLFYLLNVAWGNRRLAPGRLRSSVTHRDFGVSSFEQLLASFTAGPEELRAFVGPGPLLTDDRSLTEYFLSLPRDKPVHFSRLQRSPVSAYVTE